MKKVLAILIAVLLVSFAVTALAQEPEGINASLTIEHPSGIDGIVWNSQDTCCASQSMIDLSIESLNLNWSPEFNPQLDAHVTVDETYNVSGDSNATSAADSDADANADASGDSNATATASATESPDGGDADAFAGTGNLGLSGAGAGAAAFSGADSESEVEANADFDSDVDVDLKGYWKPVVGYAGEFSMQNVVLLYMNQDHNHLLIL